MDIWVDDSSLRFLNESCATMGGGTATVLVWDSKLVERGHSSFTEKHTY